VTRSSFNRQCCCVTLYGREQRGGSAALSMRQLLGLAYWRLPVCTGAFAQHSAPVSAHRLGPFSNSASLATALAGSFGSVCATLCFRRLLSALRWFSFNGRSLGFSSSAWFFVGFAGARCGCGCFGYPGPSPNFGFKKLLPT